MINDELMGKLMKNIEVSNKKTIEEANRNQTHDIKDYIKKEIEELSRKFEEKLKQNKEEHEIKFNELNQKYDKLEEELRRNNIVIFGIENQEEDLRDSVINTLKNLLQIELTASDINNVYTIGKHALKKPIVVKFTTYLMKKQILVNCKKLKGTPITIAEQLTPKQLIDNKVLRKHLKLARAKKQKAIIVRDKLIINNKGYTAQELIDKEENSGDTEENSESEENRKTVPFTSTRKEAANKDYQKKRAQETVDGGNFIEEIAGHSGNQKEKSGATSKLRSTRRVNTEKNKTAFNI